MLQRLRTEELDLTAVVSRHYRIVVGSKKLRPASAKVLRSLRRPGDPRLQGAEMLATEYRPVNPAHGSHCFFISGTTTAGQGIAQRRWYVGQLCPRAVGLMALLAASIRGLRHCTSAGHTPRRVTAAGPVPQGHLSSGKRPAEHSRKTLAGCPHPCWQNRHGRATRGWSCRGRNCDSALRTRNAAARAAALLRTSWAHCSRCDVDQIR